MSPHVVGSQEPRWFGQGEDACALWGALSRYSVRPRMTSARSIPFYSTPLHVGLFQERKAEQSSDKKNLENELLQKKRRQLEERQRKQAQEEVCT